MGNKFCKKRVDNTDASGVPHPGANGKSPKTLNKIINKLNLKPKWKSDPNLEDKQVTRPQTPISTIQIDSKPLSRSTDWIDCALEPVTTPEPRETKKTIFNDDTTPTPPPRKCTRVRRSLVDKMKDAFKPSSTSTPTPQDSTSDEPEIEEQIMVKRTINYNCPCGGPHSRAQHDKQLLKKLDQEPSSTKRSRSILATSSNNSLPNYNDFRLSLPTHSVEDDAEDTHTSALSLPDETNNPKKMNRRSLTNDFDAYLTRAKSIGSLIPNVLHRLSTNKAPLAQIESDDSLNSINSMENWAGLTMIEHYEPRESSLPRPSKRADLEVMSDLEMMIVSNEVAEAQMPKKPKPPARKSETLLKKIHKDIRSSKGTPPSTPEDDHQGQGLMKKIDGRPIPHDPSINDRSGDLTINDRSVDPSINDRSVDPSINDHSTLLKFFNDNPKKDGNDFESKLNEINETNKNLMKNNLSPVHTYKVTDLTSNLGGNKGHINEFLAAERTHDELYKERIAT